MLTSKSRVLFIADIDSPYLIKLAEEMLNYADFQLLFLEESSLTRGSFWTTPRGPNVKKMQGVVFNFKSIIFKGRYLVLFSLLQIWKLKPNFIIVSGFSKFISFQVLLYSKLFRVPLYVFTERSRDSSGVIRKKNSIFWIFVSRVFKGISAVIVTHNDIVEQYLSFGFRKVVVCPYPADIQHLLDTPIKVSMLESSSRGYFNIIFPNRLTNIYNPVFCIELAKRLHAKDRRFKFFFNADGEMFPEINQLIRDEKLSSCCSFIEVRSWDELGDIYAEMDVMVLPAIFSNGNFTIIECMARGTGIIISDRVLGCGKDVINGYNGFVCSLEVDKFYNSVLCYFHNMDLIKVHGNRSKKLVEYNSVRSVAIKLVDILNCK